MAILRVEHRGKLGHKGLSQGGKRPASQNLDFRVQDCKTRLQLH